MRLIVLGASSGLGRSLGVSLAQGGKNDVALLARREDRLAGTVEEAGSTSFALSCDVTDEDSCTKAIGTAVERLGGLDGLIYTVGIGPMGHIQDIDAANWRKAFDTNVVGAAVATSAALPHLQASNGHAIYLSSISASDSKPWPGLGAYLTSKAALDKMIDAFRVEHPAINFTRVVMGDCAGGPGDSVTGFADAWDPELAMEMVTLWMNKGLVAGQLVPVEELVRVVELIISSDPVTSIPSIVLTPKPAM
jgi:NAD(P)-dependent dehydrogenase (short-subunit alcohol dehydrogenase family)